MIKLEMIQKRKTKKPKRELDSTNSSLNDNYVES